MQSVGPGQAPVYGASYYPTPYTASYGTGRIPRPVSHDRLGLDPARLLVRHQ